MQDQSIGWIAAIIIGGFAGWLAEQFMKSERSCSTIGHTAASIEHHGSGFSSGPLRPASPGYGMKVP